MSSTLSLASGKTDHSSFANMPCEIRQKIILEAISSTVEDLPDPAGSDEAMPRLYKKHPVFGLVIALHHVCATIREETLAVTRTYIEQLSEQCLDLGLTILKMDDQRDEIFLPYRNVLDRIPEHYKVYDLTPILNGPEANTELFREYYEKRQRYDRFDTAYWDTQISMRSKKWSLLVLWKCASRFFSDEESLETGNILRQDMKINSRKSGRKGQSYGDRALPSAGLLDWWYWWS